MENELVDGYVVGKRRGARIKKRWTPKEWRPEYEAIVALSCTGVDNTEIGRRFGYTKEHISNILNCPQAKALKEKIRQKVNDQALEDIPSLLAEGRQLAAKRALQTLRNDTLAVNSPMAMFDRALAFMKAVGSPGITSGGDPESNSGSVTVNQHNIQQNTFILNQRDSDNIQQGILAAREVASQHERLLTAGPADHITTTKDRGEDVHAVHNGRVEVPAKTS